jgi:predicted nucleic acid-binding protein
VVFDTNVFAYALLNVPEYRVHAARALEQTVDVLIPDSFRAEFANVVWQWIRARGVSIDAGLGAIRKAEALVTRVVPVNLLWEEALSLAVQKDHPVYDTVFVALAAFENTRVVTFDRRLLERFPEYTLSVTRLLKG